MKMLLTFLKNEFIRISKINLLRYGDANKSQRTIIMYLVIWVLALAFIFSYTSEIRNIFLLSLVEDEIINVLVMPMVMICILLNISISIFWGSGLLLSDTNANMQLAFPIHESILTISKLFILYVVAAFLDTLLLLPMTILFGTATGKGIHFYLITMVNVLLLPIIPCLLGTIIGTCIYRILRNPSATLVRTKTMLSVALLLAYMVYMFWKFVNPSESSSFSFTTTVMFHSGSRYISSLLQHNILSLAAYWTAILLIGNMLLHNLIAICQSWYSNFDRHKTTIIPIRSNMFIPDNAISALINRERRRYFSTPTYATNTACGFLFAIVFVIFVGIANDKVTPTMELLSDFFQISSDAADVLYVYTLTILTSLSCTTYASISIEGEHIEVVKSLPITAQDVFNAKVRFHLSLSVPLIVILNTAMTFFLHMPWYLAVLGYIMPLSFSVFVGVLGYILNLLFPNFEWDNATQIIKQSFPVFLNTLLSVIVTFGTTYLLLKYFSEVVILGSFMACIVIILIACIMAFSLKKMDHVFVNNFEK